MQLLALYKPQQKTIAEHGDCTTSKKSKITSLPGKPTFHILGQRCDHRGISREHHSNKESQIGVSVDVVLHLCCLFCSLVSSMSHSVTCFSSSIWSKDCVRDSSSSFMILTLTKALCALLQVRVSSSLMFLMLQ